MIGRTMTRFWKDQDGAILSAELVLLMTVVGVGAVVGIKALGNSVVTELSDVAGAIGSLDQSYYYGGTRLSDDCAWTDGSKYEDQPDGEAVVEVCTPLADDEDEADVEEDLEDDQERVWEPHRGCWRHDGQKWKWHRDGDDRQRDDCNDCRDKDRGRFPRFDRDDDDDDDNDEGRRHDDDDREQDRSQPRHDRGGWRR